MSIDDCIKAYSEIIEKVSTTKPRISFGGLGTKQYDGTVLKSAFQSIIRAQKATVNEPFLTTENQCKV